MTSPVPWEYGSDFHAQITLGQRRGPTHHFENYHYTLWASGRDALVALLRWCQEQLSVRRLWCPTYYCLPVVDSIRSTGLHVRFYSESPATPDTAARFDELAPGDLLLTTGYFGLQAPLHIDPPDGVVVVEDHTHDPWAAWAERSDAHFCLASLRKTLPIPDGGILWSRRGLHGPKQIPFQPHRAPGVLTRLSGMLLKDRYLSGELATKQEFRSCLLAGEESFAQGEPSGMSDYAREVLFSFDWQSWRQLRMRNFRLFARRLKSRRNMLVLTEQEEGGAALSVVLRFASSHICSAVRTSLLMQNTYPSVLWPLESNALYDIPLQQVELSRRLLCIPCDGRYAEADIEKVCGILASALGSEDAQ